MLRKPKLPAFKFDKVDLTRRQRRTLLNMKPPATGFEKSDKKPRILHKFDSTQSEAIPQMLRRKKQPVFGQREPPIREQILQTTHAEAFQQLTPKQQEETINHITSMKETFATYGQDVPLQKLVELAITAVREKK